MKITILNTSSNHPVNAWLEKWILKNEKAHDIDLVRSRKELTEGDLLFLISCSEFISASDRMKYSKTLVIHASDLPKGRGWSPHIWEILNGAESIILTLLEAEDKIDSGPIWKKIQADIPKTALYDEINSIIFDSEILLMDFAIENFSRIVPVQQDNIEATFWPRRTELDSEIDIQKSIAEQFDLIRVCDPDRYPAFFHINGKKFKFILEVIDE